MLCFTPNNNLSFQLFLKLSEVGYEVEGVGYGWVCYVVRYGFIMVEFRIKKYKVANYHWRVQGYEFTVLVKFFCYFIDL